MIHIMSDSIDLKDRKKHLFKDKILKKAFKNLEPLYLPPSGNVYNELIKAIVYQQISYKAADAIFGRLSSLFQDKLYEPQEMLEHTHDTLRSIGLSNQKATYCRNISEYFLAHALYDCDWSKRDDKSIIKLLTEIKGVGQWTAEMMLLFELKRPDVFPVGDLAIRQALISLYGLTAEKKALIKELNQMSEKWKPYRSTVTLYLWSWKRAQELIKKAT